MSSPVVCVDLDRTVIYSARALSLPMPDAEAPRLLCVEIYQGAPLSFMTEAAAADLGTLSGLATVVPTTTRTPAQLARVHLPGPPARFAIASNGGHLFVDGELDEGWTAGVVRSLDACATLVEVRSSLDSRVSEEFVESLRVASDLFFYAVVHRDRIPSGWLEELGEWCAERGWAMSLQGRKLYVLPGPLTKSAAAAEVMRRVGGTMLYAAGDSLLDAELLTSADLAIRPAHGELAQTGFTAPNLTVTDTVGALAGEEILRWLVRGCRTEYAEGEALGSLTVRSAR